MFKASDLAHKLVVFRLDKFIAFKPLSGRTHCVTSLNHPEVDGIMHSDLEAPLPDLNSMPSGKFDLLANRLHVHAY